MESIIGISEAAKKLGKGEQQVREMLKNNKCTFGIAYKRDGSTRHTYKIDSNALDRCLNGEQNLFKN